MERGQIIHARPRLLVGSDIGAFALGAIVLGLCFALTPLFSPLAFALLMTLWAVAFGLDVLRWFQRGIRDIRLEEEGFTLWRGARGDVTTIKGDDIEKVLVKRRLWRGTIVVRLKAAPSGGRAAPRPRRARRLKIADDAFSKADFALLAAALVSPPPPPSSS